MPAAASCSQPALPKTTATAAVLLLAWVVMTMGWWAFAFFQLPTVPEWFSRAQAVCFGMLPNGLPNAAGWMMLIGAPLMMLGALVALFSGEIMRSVQQRLHFRSGVVIAGILFFASAVEASWVVQRVAAAVKQRRAPSAESLWAMPAEYPRQHERAPEFDLVDQHGARWTTTSLKKKVTLLTFAFAHCQTVCPTLVNQVQQAIKTANLASAQSIAVTLDPWRDTPRALPALAKKWQLTAGSHVLSGAVDDVLATLDRYKVPRTRDEKTGEITHPALVYVIDGEGQIAYTLNNPTVSWLVDAMHRVVDR